MKGTETVMGYVSWIGIVDEQDSVLVEILKQQGAVVYCKTNVPQTLMVLLVSLLFSFFSFFLLSILAFLPFIAFFVILIFVY